MCRLNVLVVENERLIREGIGRYVPWNELELNLMACVKNGQEALDFVLNNEIDIILSDIRMPKMDGLALAENIIKAGKNPMMIYISGYSDFSYAQQAIKYQIVFDYILKPINVEKIVEVLKKAKEVYRQRKSKVNIPYLSSQDVMEYLEGINFKEINVKDKIFSYIRSGQYQKAKEYFSILWDGFIEQNVPYDYVARYCCGFVLTLTDIFIEISINIKNVFECEDPIKKISEISDLKLLEEYMDKVIRNSCNKILNSFRTKLSALIFNAIRITEKYYCQHDFTLQWLSDKLFVTPNYLSTKFKDEVGVGLIKYINTKRIEKAKEQLLDVRYKIYEISGNVGIEDVRYFSRLFKEYTGMTPRDFRDKHK